MLVLKEYDDERSINIINIFMYILYIFGIFKNKKIFEGN